MSATDFFPTRKTLPALHKAASQCEGCPLYAHATQTVFGEGPANASVMLVGEVPGDREDREGKPFVGPAGRLMDEALEQAGIDRKTVYITNAVKHFKFVLAGKRRLHQKPTWKEMTACRPWLEAEIEVIQPKVIVCLGATAAQSLLGKDFRLTRELGKFQASDWAPWILATYHPAAVLRAPDEKARMQLREELFSALRMISDKLSAS